MTTKLRSTLAKLATFWPQPWQNLGTLASHLLQLLQRLENKPRCMVYDCEIKYSPQCSADWRDFKRLGLSVFGCYCNWLPEAERWQAFTEDTNFAGVQDLIDQAEEIIGFNSLRFDDALCEAHGIRIKTTFDLMVEVRRAAGEPLFGPCTPGYKLLRIAEANLGEDLPQVRLRSRQSPSQVPDLWRSGEREKVIKHCLNDVFLTHELYKRRHKLADPVRLNRLLHCDPVTTDWREVWATIVYLFDERFFNFQFNETWHWSGAKVIKIRLAISESLVLSFPVWMLPIKTWRQYTGLPFQLNKANPVKSDRERELDAIYTYPTDKEGQDADPIPF